MAALVLAKRLNESSVLFGIRGRLAVISSTLVLEDYEATFFPARRDFDG